MNYLKLFIVTILFLGGTYAQDSLNCKLLSKTGNIVNAYGLAVKDNYAFVTSDKLYILDISDIYSPILVFSDSLAPQICSVSLDSNYAYLAANDGLIILDISSYESPEVISYLKTTEYIEEITVHNNIAYLGTLNYAFLVIDVSDPQNPYEIGRVDTGIDDVWGLEIYNNLLFAASEDTGVKIFDISDPSNPEELATLTLIYGTTAVDVKIKGNVAYVTHPNSLYAFDISDLSNPQMLCYLPGAGGLSIDIEGDYAYCTSYHKLTVTDISNPSDLIIAGYYPLSIVGSDVYVKNKMVLATCQNEGIFFIEFDAPTSIQEDSDKSKAFSFSQNYPNPFNSSTIINYTISNPERVQIKIYDHLGKEINTLLNEYQQAGSYNVRFNSNSLSSGVYYYRIITGDYLATKKMLLIK